MKDSPIDDESVQRIVVLLPVFNDWEALEAVLQEVWLVLSSDYQVRFCLVDDGSRIAAPFFRKVGTDWSWDLLRLGCNLGHQRAICVGLSWIVAQSEADVIVVMDSDGEDDPSAISTLVNALNSYSCDVVVAQRASRSEGPQFRVLYGLYKAVFRLLVGESLDFGNFSALKLPAVKRLTYMNEAWNHYPGALMRSGLLVGKVPVARTTRIAGNSHMNVTSLVTHGLAGLSVFLDRVMTRLTLMFTFLLIVLTATIGLGVFVRLSSQVPIPGWLALGTTAAFIGIVQIVATLLILTFVSLSARARPTKPPFDFSRDFIADVNSSGS